MRWRILAILTFARMSMAFQFQSVPALARPLAEEYGLGFAAIGTLTGAYLLPGALIALLGGWIAHRLGDARVAVAGLALMSVGGFAGWFSTDFELSVFWRLLAGIGAVGLNVMVTKMAADWFDGRSDLPVAMGLLVSSWPAGLALSTAVLPVLAQAQSLDVAGLVPTLFCALGWVLMVLFWRAPERAGQPPKPATTQGFHGRELLLVVVAGTIWGLYNVAFVGTLAWTPGLLQSRGIGPVEAAAAVSLVGWASILSVAFGGVVLSLTRHKEALALLAFLLAGIIVLGLAALGPAAGSIPVLALLGLVQGFPAAFVMMLPVVAARQELRARAMGIYFAIYYATMGVAPTLLGGLLDISGEAAAPLYAAAALLLLSAALTMAFRRVRGASL